MVADNERQDDLVVILQAAVYETDASEEEVRGEIEQELASSVLEVGRAQKVLYREIYVCSMIEAVPKGKLGASFSAVPYVMLPKDAIPKGDVTSLTRLSLSEWEAQVRTEFLSCTCRGKSSIQQVR